jgi:type I restriction enzyme S subunit
VLVVSIGTTLGKVGFSEDRSSVNQQINAVVPNHRIDGYFLAYSLSVKAEVMRYLSNASTIGIMNQEKTKDISVAVPPFQEQSIITEYLDAETAKFDALTSEAQRAIELLPERRTTLISAAVTGQIDVRPLGHAVKSCQGGFTPYSDCLSRSCLPLEISKPLCLSQKPKIPPIR